MSRALKRVEAFLANLEASRSASWLMRVRPTTSATDQRWAALWPADLRAVVALAKRQAELDEHQRRRAALAPPRTKPPKTRAQAERWLSEGEPVSGVLAWSGKPTKAKRDTRRRR